jgi:hypothetical protein
MRIAMFATLTALSMTLALTTAHGATDEELIANAKSAAPKAVGDNATIVGFNEDGSMRTLQEGTNNFT